jgi:hypothetical protein
MVNAKESIMARISILYVVSSMLAALALSANGAIAKGGGSHGGGSDAGKTKSNELAIKKTTDKASPVFIQQKAVKGTHYKSVKIQVRKAGGTTVGNAGSNAVGSTTEGRAK